MVPMIAYTSALLAAMFVFLPQAVKEPQYNLEAHYIADSGDVILLEKVAAPLKTAGGRLLVNRSSRLVVIDGQASTVRFPSAHIPHFVIKGLPQDKNPADLLVIYQFDIKRSSRELIIATQGALDASSTTSNMHYIPLDF